MANYIEVMGPGPDKVLLAINHIVKIKAIRAGCVLTMIATASESSHTITLKTDYRTFKAELINAVQSGAVIHSLVEDIEADFTLPYKPIN